MKNFKKKFIVAIGALAGASLFATQQADASTYTVKPGDTISSIAKKKYKKASLEAVETIVQANKISDRNLIFVGDKLKLPKKIKKIKINKTPCQASKQPQSNVQIPAQSTQPIQPKQGSESQNTSSATTPSSGGSDWKSYVTSRMEKGTGVSAGTWAKIISRESGWQSGVTNSSGHYGLFQLSPGYKGHGGSVEEQIEGAIDLFKKQGLGAWSETAW